MFDPDGAVILDKELTANILTSGISKNGKYAFCDTANSPTDHGNKVFLFDLAKRVELYGVTPRAGWPERYERRRENRRAHRAHQGRGELPIRHRSAFVMVEAQKALVPFDPTARSGAGSFATGVGPRS